MTVSVPGWVVGFVLTPSSYRRCGPVPGRIAALGRAVPHSSTRPRASRSLPVRLRSVVGRVQAGSGSAECDAHAVDALGDDRVRRPPLLSRSLFHCPRCCWVLLPTGRRRLPRPAPAVLSLVIPVYNEEEVVPILRAELTTWMAAQPFKTELVLVNDGSADRSTARR